MSFFSRKPKDQLLFVLDIQSSLVRGSLIIMHPAHQPEITFSYEKSLPYRQNGGSSYLIKIALKAVTETVTATLRHLEERKRADDAPHSVSAVHYALSSPWIVSQAKTVSMVFPKETPVTEKLVGDLIAKQRIEMLPDPDERISTVEEKVFDVRLNGYSVSFWKDRRAKDIGISFVTSIAGSAMLERFREASAPIASAKRTHFHSSLLLQTIGIRSVMPDRSAYTLTHVHGELTDVVVVDHSACVFFGSYPMGSQTVVRKIAGAANTDVEAADSLLTLYVGGNLDVSRRSSLAPVIQDIGRGWNNGFNRLFKDSHFSAPSGGREVVLFSRRHEGFFISAFMSEHPGAKVEPLAVELIEKHVSYRPQIERMRVTGLYAIALRDIQHV